MASVENRGSGRWRLVVSAGYDEQGKQRKVTRTIKLDPKMTPLAQKREALKQAAALETDYGRGTLTAAGKTTMNELFGLYLNARSISPRTREAYTWLFNDAIRDALGTVAVQDLTPRRLQRFFSDLAGREAGNRSRTGKLSANAIKHYHTLLRALLNFAIKLQVIAVSPLAAIDPPRNDTEETKFYEPADLARLLSCLEKEPLLWRTFFSLAVYTGCRPGELIGADWSDYDGQVLTIRAGAARENGHTVRTPRPKTRASERKIDLPSDAVILLNQWRNEQAEHKEKLGEWHTDAIFSTATGWRMDLSSPTQRFQKIIMKYDLPPLTLYGLRHSHASALIAAGLDVRTVAARLGHSQTSTTLNIYSHAFEKANSAATQAISDAITRARENQKNGE